MVEQVIKQTKLVELIEDSDIPSLSAEKVSARFPWKKVLLGGES